MFHLFNKVYLEIDDKINLESDRVVISQQNGVPMSVDLERVTAGRLYAYGKTIDEVAPNFSEFIEFLKTASSASDKKVIVYADHIAYKNFISTWLKSLLPNLTQESFKTIVDHTIYKERVLANSSLSLAFTRSMQTLWDDFGDFTEQWNTAKSYPIDTTGMDLSYEFLIADYLSGSTKYEVKLQETVYKFLVRWFKELFTDNRQMCLINITNSRLQADLGIDPTLIDITSANPFSQIPALYFYADESIWRSTAGAASSAYGYITFDNLTAQQAEGLKNTILYVYSKFEGMQIDNWVFNALNWVDIATRPSITKAEMDEILNFIISSPFDTCLVPRFDFENVNFPLFLHFLSQKKNNQDLTSYRLI